MLKLWHCTLGVCVAQKSHNAVVFDSTTRITEREEIKWGRSLQLLLTEEENADEERKNDVLDLPRTQNIIKYFILP